MDNIRLLVVDRENAVRNAIKKKAASEGYTCDEAGDGISALKLFKRIDYNLVILDTELPELDGRNVCRQIRKVSNMPIIILTARNEENDRLACFELGVDDYITKPFSPAELMARIKVFLYRSGGFIKTPPRRISFGGLLIDTSSRAVYIDDKMVRLTPKEYDLLYFFSQNPNKAFSRDMLLNEVWGFDFIGMDRTVDSHIKTLRESIRPYNRYIVTVWGFGYKFAIYGE